MVKESGVLPNCVPFLKGGGADAQNSTGTILKGVFVDFPLRQFISLNHQKMTHTLGFFFEATHRTTPSVGYLTRKFLVSPQLNKISL
jgi:hypothetical protein